MTTRERMQRVLRYEKPDQIPNLDFGYWNETLPLWHTQGLPDHIQTHEDMERFMGLEGVSIWPYIPLSNHFCPAFTHKTLEENEKRRIIQDLDGNICEVPTDGASVPRYLRYAIESRHDWEVIKSERLDIHHPQRIGSISKAIADAQASGMPLIFNAGSLYGWLRNWMGVENISIAILTERDWVEEMMEHLTLLTLQLIRHIPFGAVDLAWWWEDMCYNKGPLISPRLFQDLMVPRYRRITEALREKGTDLNILDCDGSIYELVPGWLDAGIQTMFPIEAAHTDPLELRRRFGRDLLLVGGVNKIALSHGPAAIDRELARLQPLMHEGGFIPCVDHRVPPDVSLANYRYYLEKKSAYLRNSI